ncbi:MAG: DNA-3-methyladenine glycosylase 2 family protein [Candidatus Omnitrophica bacterium]|nr:DNA-3-methyladenine glycosylase 2 family protein [Candidatus Omnitrophota bacterium]
MPVRRFTPLAPLDPGRVVPTLGIGRGDPSIAIDDGAWIAVNTGVGPATLRYSAAGDEVEIEAWGSGAERGLELAPGMIGADDDPAEFLTDHPVMRRLLKAHPGVRITRSRMVTAALLRAVFGQKVTGKEAKRSYRRMTRSLGEPAPGPHPDLVLPSDPSRIATLGYEDFHPWGVERKRAETLLEVARRSKRLEEANEMGLVDAYGRITALRGVGPWSAALVGMQALGDADAVPIGDYHIPNTVSWVLTGEPRGDDDRMLELLEPFRPHRGRAVRLIKATSIKAPRYGPRAPLRSIENI